MDLGILQNSRTKQTFLFTKDELSSKSTEAHKSEYEILKGLAELIRSGIYDPQEIVNSIKIIQDSQNN